MESSALGATKTARTARRNEPRESDLARHAGDTSADVGISYRSGRTSTPAPREGADHARSSWTFFSQSDGIGEGHKTPSPCCNRSEEATYLAFLDDMDNILGFGGTPLLRCRRRAPTIDSDTLWLGYVSRK